MLRKKQRKKEIEIEKRMYAEEANALYEGLMGICYDEKLSWSELNKIELVGLFKS